jgi:hypothetical protein
VIDAQELAQLNPGADLLEALAHGRVGGVLVVVDEAAGQTPVTVAGLDGPPAEDYAPLGVDDDGGCNLRVAPQDEVIVLACLDLVAFYDPRRKRPTAFQAKMTQRWVRL